MTRRLGISRHQAQTLLKAAEAERAIVEIQQGDVIYRLIPACLVPEPAKKLDADEEIRL